jgi:hypothetical protein
MADWIERSLSKEEHAIAEWLLTHSVPPALSYLPQLDLVRVTGKCKCGCPTIHLRVPVGTTPAEIRDNPIGDAFGNVDGNLVGVMILQRDGFMTCLEVYDLSEISRPYGLPDFTSLQPAVWNQT